MKTPIKLCIVSVVILFLLVLVQVDFNRKSFNREGSYCSGKQYSVPTTRDEILVGHAPDVPNSFPVDEATFCSSSPDLKVIAYVASTIAAIQKRNVTRQTWGSVYKHGIGIPMKVIFMVGKPKDLNEEKILNTESRFYHDIVQGDYTEDYHLVTYKILSSMYWVSTRCPSVPWVIRADDDILVDPFMVNKLLPEASKEGFSCYVWKRMPTSRQGKWSTTKKEWRETYLPPFCAGAFVFHHHQLLHSLLQASCYNPVIWMEDVYVFGILAREAGGLKSWLSVLNPHHIKNIIKIEDIGVVTSWVDVENRTFWWKRVKDYHGFQ